MNRRKFSKLISLGSAAVAVVSNMPPVLANAIYRNGSSTYFEENNLLNGFIHPPYSAQPWTYWMWLDGNVSKKGITSDLEALKKIGIGGVLIMNLGLPPNEEIQPGPVRFMSPEWRGMVKHAISEADRLGLQINMNNDDGWNSGGPWITPEMGMQRLTWSRTSVSGPLNILRKLPKGRTNLDTYSDVAVLAFPVRKKQDFPPALETRGQKASGTWIQHDYGQKITVRSLSISNPKMKPGSIGPKTCELSVSDDGMHFKSVRKFETGWISLTAPRNTTIRLGEVTGRYFRMLVPDATICVEGLKFKLNEETLLDHWNLKAGFSYIREHGGGSPMYELPVEYPPLMDEMVTKSDQVIDLTGNLLENGNLKWDVPEGEWIILRIGYTPTKKTNGYATAEGSGLDSDKYNPNALELHLSGMVDKILDDSKSFIGKSLPTIHTDSWESGAANWTASFPQEFKKRRGYDLTRWLPVMAGGQIISSEDESERFLWDIRRTIADIYIDNHLKHFRELAHKRGLTFSSEGAGRQQFMYDPISFQVCSDLPMGEFWNSPQETRPRPDCKAAASAAHIQGLSIAGAEAFTQNQNNAGCWLESPFSLKALGDSVFCTGINKLYFHRTIAQPEPGEKPGMTWPKVGINFDISQTWWEPGRAWIDYLTRCQYLLQQGKFVADVAILTDEGAPSSLTRVYTDLVEADEEYDTSTITESALRHFNRMHFLPPAGYDYDFINAEAVHAMEVSDGKLYHPGGMSYRILVLPPSERMTLSLIRKISTLVKAGATIVGIRPGKSPTLSDFPNGDTELRAIAHELWGDEDNEQLSRKVGFGSVFKGDSTKEALESLNLRPDFEYSPADNMKDSNFKIDYIHRNTDTADIYFISNQQQLTADLNCLFRITNRQPEFWLPDTGEVIMPAELKQGQGRTALSLRLDPSGSIFVVFQKPGSSSLKSSSKKLVVDTKVIKKIKGSWSVSFDPKWGGPEKHIMKKLQSWAMSKHKGIKYYSGTATYKKKIRVPQGALHSGKVLYLDLGSVKEIATIRFNGEDLGILWKPPYRIEITSFAKEGDNLLEIDVTNLWPNRLIGDAALQEKDRIATVNWNPYNPESPLLESGLIGPMTLQAGI